ncbi:hypothetical protein DM01DRAFT_1238232 [Hesseltinella vesiculosa]|uniref:Uncharacterized protein n=1 Tax=Hesseltinella vesiculosa TaxID=101127 RepID=A0A1X2GLX8_9FUNG|nr:hypothetical protein DM01DRAFT_1238232 [Hesseltinella vesiculosa]
MYFCALLALPATLFFINVDFATILPGFLFSAKRRRHSYFGPTSIFQPPTSIFFFLSWGSPLNFLFPTSIFLRPHSISVWPCQSHSLFDIPFFFSTIMYFCALLALPATLFFINVDFATILPGFLFSAKRRRHSYFGPRPFFNRQRPFFFF